jgi:hypothetical protein
MESKIDALLAAIAGIDDKSRLESWSIDQAPLLAVLRPAELLRMKRALISAGLTKKFVEGDLSDLIDDERPLRQTARDEGAEPYRVTAGKICARTRVGAGDDTYFDYLPLCNFDARIMADVEMDDGEEITRHVAVAGTLANGRRLPEITIPAEDFDSLGWVAKRWGSRPILETGRNTRDRLRHAIQTLSADSMVSRSIYTHTGWREIDGKRVFLHGAGALGADGVAVEMPGRLTDYAFPADDAITPRDAMIECIKLLDLAPLSVTAPIWAAMFLAPLSEMITPAFTLWVEGPSGSKKSTLTGLMLNMFGAKFHEKHMPADWLSTANHLEMLTFHAKNIPLIIDDYRPGETKQESKEMADKAARIMRAVGNRQGRGRLTKERGAARAYIPRGVVISTAELGTIGKSVVARQLTVDVRRDDIDMELLTAAQGQRHVYSYAMSGFIQWVGENWSAIETGVSDAMTDRRRNGDRSQHSRLPDAANALYCAFDVAMNYATAIGAITKQEADEWCKLCDLALLDIARRQQQKVEQEDPANKFMSVLTSLIHSRKIMIEGKKRPDLGGETRIGWWNGVEINLLPEAAYNAVVGFMARSGDHFSATPVDLARDLHEAGWLAATDADRMRVSRRDGGKQHSVLSLSASKWLAYISEMGLSIDDLCVKHAPRDEDAPGA